MTVVYLTKRTAAEREAYYAGIRQGMKSVRWRINRMLVANPEMLKEADLLFNDLETMVKLCERTDL